jgi:hypothetical protein
MTQPSRPLGATLAIYGTGIGLSAFLLFVVQPLVGRLALPVFGGVPAAWATVLAFFQGVLLLGYLYGHVSVTRLGLRRGALMHVVVAAVAVALLVVAPADWATLRVEGMAPGLNLLLILLVAVGPAAFLLAATTPLLSAWYAAVRDAETPGAVDPYWLYALSNAASLAALLAYPLLLEWTVGLSAQRALWTAGVAVFAVVAAAAAWRVRRSVAPGEHDARASKADAPGPEASAPIDWRRRLRWFVLAAIPTGLLTAVTTFITTDLVSAPLLWVGPLALYLLSYVVAFSGRGTRLVRLANGAGPAAATLLWVPVATGAIWPTLPLIAVVLGSYGVVATALHGRLAADRPAPARLTELYLVIALAGVTAGAFVALVAPAIFPDNWEYPLLVGLAVAALALTVPPAGADDDELRPRTGPDLGPHIAGALGRAGPYVVVSALLALALVGRDQVTFEAGLSWLAIGGIVLVLGGVPKVFVAATAAVLVLAVLVLPPAPIFRERSFFGVSTVVPGPNGDRLELLNGTTVHGLQYLDEARRNRASTYYVEEGPLGDVVRLLQERPADPARPGASVGVVGLGAGEIATYSRAGDRWTYYEIDPVVVRVATDPLLFTHVSDAAVPVAIAVGDGRLELERVPDATHDLLVLDAFTSDAIPAHLLTVEALRAAMRTVAPGGLLAVHLSNRHYDLTPAVAAAARDLGLTALRRIYAPSEEVAADGGIGSVWMALAREPGDLAPLAAAGWEPVPSDSVAPITDDRPDVLRFLLVLQGR